jgi:hypothetical protein
LQRSAYVREAVGEEEGGSDEQGKEKEFHVGSDNGRTERFKADDGGPPTPD